MALQIVESCVNCWACVDVCPSEAISPGTAYFRISAHKCTECDGDYAEQQCASICPIEGAILLADGSPANPAGSLTGIPPERLAEAMRTIQAR
ncbi:MULTISPECIES: 4Fe-4S binding protein [Pseudomonadaceae]|jgi:Fe-S-cluster-containing hydrogenase component 2|uniref:4Fe-4S binding protein n=1 Tax=Stutzerimonas stutzeri TaxID=316 RepID=A0A0D7E094_STUST|nr:MULTISPECIES: 4Fe-4S binding protein [Pseudomonadaceae]NMY64678.1 4Fe-4S binding protein [Pseudomonas sp. WS 5018]OCX97925.1 MAG: ferredoxin [Pseudomonas sp. K35]OHC21473.1 MAG: ferredoxin [Pseudomonadales bacterium RIFCSPHIGHO2_01_FULL_64_12]HAV03559.1 ferredoxin [Pseudomonas sp.]AEA83247.1 ferredoxin-like protein [Stutzerimonas stutzeri DSM 4166]